MNNNIAEINMMITNYLKIHQMMIDEGQKKDPSYISFKMESATILEEKIQEQEIPIQKHSKKNLIEMARKKGIKGAKLFTIKTLCEHLNIPLNNCNPSEKGGTNPIKITFTDVENDEKIEFSSIHKAAASIEKTAPCINYYIVNKKVISYKEKKWIVSR